MKNKSQFIQPPDASRELTSEEELYAALMRKERVIGANHYGMGLVAEVLIEPKRRKLHFFSTHQIPLTEEFTLQATEENCRNAARIVWKMYDCIVVDTKRSTNEILPLRCRG